MIGLFIIGLIIASGLTFLFVFLSKIKEEAKQEEQREKEKKEEIERKITAAENYTKKLRDTYVTKIIITREEVFELKQFEEFLKAIGETYKYDRIYHNNSMWDCERYSEYDWQPVILIDKPEEEKYVLTAAFKKWMDAKTLEYRKNFDKKVDEVLKKVKDTSAIDFYNKYMEEHKDDPKTEEDIVNQWFEEGKIVVGRPIHPGISNEEMGDDSWEPVAAYRDDYEFQLAEKVVKFNQGLKR